MFSQLKDFIVNNQALQFKAAFKPLEHANLYDKANLLHWACACGNIDIIQILLDAGISLLSADDWEYTALQYAVKYDYFNVLKFILEFAISKNNIQLIVVVLNSYPQLLVNFQTSQTPTTVEALTEPVCVLLNKQKLQIVYQDGQYHIAESQPDNITTITETISQLGLQTVTQKKRPLEFSQIKYLLRQFFDLKKRMKKYERDYQLGAYSQHNHEQHLQEKQSLQILRLAIGICSPYWYQTMPYHQISEATLEGYLKQQQTSEFQYFGDDLSDNSDDEDDISIPKPSNKKNIQKLQIDYKLVQQNSSQFWLRTRRKRPKNSTNHKGINAGLDGRLSDIVNRYKAGHIKEQYLLNYLSLSKSNKNQLVLTKEVLADSSQESVTIAPNNAQVQTDIDTINRLIEQSGEFKLVYLQGVTTRFVFAKYRGLNYMEDRWRKEAKRYHQQMDEEKKPQYAEMILRALPTCFYTELSKETDFTKNSPLMEELLMHAIHVQAFFKQLESSGPCISAAGLSSETEQYCFDNVPELMQHYFSNGIDEFLNHLQQFRQHYPAYWGKLPNALNPFNATGDRPLHTLKYAFGLKKYYSSPLLPRYNVDQKTHEVSVEQLHVGKVYASLHLPEEILGDRAVYNVSVMDNDARVQIGSLIASEKETNFPVFISNNCVVHQFIAKFPSFTGPWKIVHEIKYGLNQSLYESFKYLLQISAPNTPLREGVVQLLSDWLCSYHEVRLVEVMRNEAFNQGKQLVYLTREGKLSLSSDTGLLMLPGGMNIAKRNAVHVKRSARKETAKVLSSTSVPDTTTIPGITIYSKTSAKSTYASLQHNPNFLHETAKKIQLMTEQRSDRGSKGSDFPYQNTIQQVLSSTLQNGIFSTPVESRFERQPDNQQQPCTPSKGISVTKKL